MIAMRDERGAIDPEGGCFVLAGVEQSGRGGCRYSNIAADR
jgi:hypothetical protein